MAHHRTALDAAGGAKLKLAESNLEALCRECHEAHHDRGPSEQQREWGRYIAELRRTI